LNVIRHNPTPDVSMWWQTPLSNLPLIKSANLAGARAWRCACVTSTLIASVAGAQSASIDSAPPRHDFQPGDRMIVVTRGDSLVVDTLTVQADGTVSLRGVPAIVLTGVPRSELRPYLAAQLHQYAKRDVIRADPLIRVGIVGEVAHPGYYRVPLATTLSDALMIAGGPTPQTDLTRISVRRGQRTVIGASSLRDAMVRGEYLGDLGVDAGDEIVLTPIPTKNWMLITQLGGLATGLVLALHAFKAF
jgi:protein involved in polysaccharide export with SLBB domain